MKIHQKTNRKSLKIILTLLAILLLVACGWSIYAYSERQWPFADSETGKYSETGPPQTPEQEAEESQNAKRNPQGDQKNLEKDETDKITASIGIAFSDIRNGAVEVRAFTPSVVEGNGACTAVLTRDGVTISETSRGFIDSTTTQCEPIRIPLEEFSQSGTWNLVVRYNSPSSQGSSETREVAIP